jgi:hypothetical protein
MEKIAVKQLVVNSPFIGVFNLRKFRFATILLYC